MTCRLGCECYLALLLWQRLGLDSLLAGLLSSGREHVGWAYAAALLIVARLCAQRSELGVAGHWYDTTALDDLLGVDTGLVNDDRLYRALDQLGQRKEALCAHLRDRYRQLFGVRFEFLLYDVKLARDGNDDAAVGDERGERVVVVDFQDEVQFAAGGVGGDGEVDRGGGGVLDGNGADVRAGTGLGIVPPRKSEGVAVGIG